MLIDTNGYTPKPAPKPETKPETKPDSTQGAGDKPKTGSGGRPIVDADNTQKGKKSRLDLEALPVMGGKEFKSLDKNEDGVLSGKEIKHENYDRNGDGRVTLAEFQVSRGRHVANDLMKKLDADGDGVLKGKEVKKELQAADHNGDGQVTKQELRGLIHQATGIKAEDMFAAFDGNDDKVLSGKELKKEQLERWDLNKDGQVTKDEFLAARHDAWKQSRFEDNDRNEDGYLSGNEISKEQLEKLDLDQDGRVSRDEWFQRCMPDTDAPPTDGSDTTPPTDGSDTTPPTTDTP